MYSIEECEQRCSYNYWFYRQKQTDFMQSNAHVYSVNILLSTNIWTLDLYYIEWSKSTWRFSSKIQKKSSVFLKHFQITFWNLQLWIVVHILCFFFKLKYKKNIVSFILFSYAVAIGLIDALSKRCMKIREPIETHQSVVLSVLACLGLLTKFTDICPKGLFADLHKVTIFDCMFLSNS